jgi:conjugative relaxase-like TrwC/TraI family protein
MLSVGKVGPANAGYYQSEVVEGLEDYYAGDGEAPGRWIGRADLVGAVAGSLATAVDAALLLEARSAPDGTRLGKTTVMERSVTAFDLTFSAPKSVSVLYALGNPSVVAAVEDAHTRAVEQATASVSPRISYTRTGHAGAAVVDADGVFGIRYRHRTSRAMDPQLHDHVLISNAVRTVSDSEWRTIDARGLYRQAKAAGVEYQAHLRAGLGATLGVEFSEVDDNGQADIVGIDEAVLAEFSTRSIDIETGVETWATEFIEREGRRPTLAEVGKAHKTITLATRSAKPADACLATATLRDRWRARAGQLVDVDQMLAATLTHQPSPVAVSRPTIDEVLAAVETRHAEWAEPQLIEQIAMRVTGPDPATISAVIEGVRAEAMASAGVVDLTPTAVPGDTLRESDGRPVHLPPSAVRYATSRHLAREFDIVDWAKSAGDGGHRAVVVDAHTVESLDDHQVAAVTMILTMPRPVITVVGPAGAGKTRMLAADVSAWQSAGVPVFGVGPSASAARQLQHGAGMVGDTLHKLVYEHSTKQANGRGPADSKWDLPERSVVIIDEAGMVDTRLLHQYAQIAQAKNWRTVLVGDHRQLDAVDAGGMFTELVHDPDVVTVELGTLHRFEHNWEADASLALRSGDTSAIDAYNRHGRIHGHDDQAAAIGAVADEAFEGAIDGHEVLVMAPTNAIVDALNATLTDRLVEAGWFDPADRIEVGGREFYPGQPVVARANNRTITYGPAGEEWVRNGDRWIVNAGTRDEMYVTSLDNGHRHALPVELIAAGKVTVDYASTINRAQGATVDEAHLIIDDRTNAKQLYVGATRGRNANHIHTAPPAFDLDDHSLNDQRSEWTPTDAVSAVLGREPDDVSAIARRRQLRDLGTDPGEHDRRRHANEAVAEVDPRGDPGGAVSERAAAAMRRLQRYSRRPRQSLER